MRPIIASGQRTLLFLSEHLLLVVLGFLSLAPFMWMITTSMKSPSEVFGAPLDVIPNGLNFYENYAKVFSNVPMIGFMINGLLVVAGILFVQVIIAIFCGYALAKLNFRGRQLLFGLVLLGLCVPFQVPALPVYLALAQLGALNTYFSLMVPFFLSVFAIFLFRQLFRGFPEEILQAARLDGMGEFEIVLRIILPSAGPAIAAFAVFSITAHWNDLYWPLIVVKTMDRATPPLGMLLFRDSAMSADFGALTAGATLITLPLLIVFILAQGQFVRGITMSGFK